MNVQPTLLDSPELPTSTPSQDPPPGYTQSVASVGSANGLEVEQGVSG